MAKVLALFLLCCSCFLAGSRAFTCFSTTDCRGDAVSGVTRSGDCCAGAGLSFLVPDEACTNCFREEAFVGEGNTFFLGFFNNFFPGQFYTQADTRLLVGVNEGEAVRFMVEARGQEATYTTSRGLPTEIDLDNSLRLSSIQTRDKGIVVRSLQGEALSVVALAEEFTSIDTFKVLPCVYLPDFGYEYYAVSVPIIRIEIQYDDPADVEPEFQDPLGNSAIVIVASEDDTNITLNLTQSVDISAAQDLVNQIGANAIANGSLETITLNRVQTLYISSADDLTGSRVVSDKPIAFISGHECGTLPNNFLFCDQLVEQIPPTSTWGRRFITTSIAARTQYDMFKVVSSRDGTVFSGLCTTNNDQLLLTPVRTNLMRGEVAALQISSNQSCYFEANNPVLLVQFSVSSNVDGVTDADPFMVIIPPVEQYRTSYEIGTFQSSAMDGANYLNILLPTIVTESTCILLNGTCISTTFTEVPCPQDNRSFCASAVQIAVPPGTHSLVNQDPQVVFSVVAYWHSFRVSHGYFGGATQRPLALPQVTLQSAMAEVYEGNVSANFTLVRSGDTQLGATVFFRTRQLSSENAAVAGVDYVAVNVTVDFLPGQTTQEVHVSLAEDDIFPEPNKTFEVYLAASPGVYLSPTTYTIVTILNDDPDLPVMNISFATTSINVREGSGVVEFVLEKTAGAVGPVTVLLTTQDGTATGQEDYMELERRITFEIEDRQMQIMTLILDNDVLEDTESFTATITPLPGLFPVAVQRSQATVTIVDNDLVVIGFSPVLYTIGEGGRSLAVTVTQQFGTLARTVQLAIFAADGSATAGTDYTVVFQDLPFSSQTPREQNVSIFITDDSEVESLESFQVRLRFAAEESDGVLLIPNEATVTITDNDVAVIGLDNIPRTVREGELRSILVTVRVLVGQLGDAVTVGVSTAAVNATAVDDFQSLANVPLVLSRERQSQQTNIGIVDDSIVEGNETFQVLLSLLSSDGRVRVSTTRASADIVIVDNEPSPTVQCFVGSESCGGTGFEAESIPDCCTRLRGSSFRVTGDSEFCQTCLLIGFAQEQYILREQSAPYTLQVVAVRGLLPQDMILGVTAIPGTASASDFQLATSRIVLTRESPSANVLVTVPQEGLSSDTLFETFRLTLSDELGLAPSNLFFRDAVVTIADFFVEVTFQQPVYSVLESIGTVTVCLESNIGTETSVEVTVTASEKTPVDAQDGMDFISGNSRSVIFPAGAMGSTRCIAIEIIDDIVALENDESFNVDFEFVDAMGARKGELPQTMVVIVDSTILRSGFQEEDYSGNEGPDRNSPLPNMPCTVIIGLQQTSIETDLTFRLTPRTISENAAANGPPPTATLRGANASRTDFNDTPFEVTMHAGTEVVTASIPIVVDEINEAEEEFVVVLEVVTGTTNPVEFTIQTVVCRIPENDPIDIGFRRERIEHNETSALFTAVLEKDRPSEQTFFIRIQISTPPILGVGEPATEGPQPPADFRIGPLVVFERLRPEVNSTGFLYQIFDDNTPENTEIFQLSADPDPNTPNNPRFSCAESRGCFQDLQVLILDDDVVVVGFVETLVEVDESDGQATLRVNITFPEPNPALLFEIMFRLNATMMSITAGPRPASSGRFDPVIPGIHDYQEIDPAIVLPSDFEGTRRLQTFNVQIFEDGVPEDVEELNITLSLRDPRLANQVIVTPAVATVRIRDNDRIVVVFERTTYTVNEGDGQVELCAIVMVPADQNIGDVTFNLAVETQDGTAMGSGIDYNSVMTTLATFTTQQLRQCFNVTIIVDTEVELTENFFANLMLTSVSTIDLNRITLNPAQATVEITDNDLQITVGYIDTFVSVFESAGVAQLTVSISVPSEATPLEDSLFFFLLVITNDGTATTSAPSDYGALMGFSLGPFNNVVRQLSFNVSIVNDVIREGNEIFTASLTLSPADRARLGNLVTVDPDLATVTIIDDDVTIIDDDEITVGYIDTAVSVFESAGVAQLTVSISVPSEATPLEDSLFFFLLVNTSDGTATTSAPSDYGALADFVLGPFNNDVRQLSFNVSIVDDMVPEEDEDFTASLTLSPDDRARLGNLVTVDPDLATITIMDDDATGPLLPTTYTNEASEFFVGFMENHPGIGVVSGTDSIFITTNQTENVVPVNITVRGSSSMIVRARAGVTNTLEISSEQTRIPPQGIHILAADNNAITVIGSNEEIFSLDGFLALPCLQLPVEQYEYYAVSVPPTTAQPVVTAESAFLIVSCNNSTQVTITPTQTITNPDASTTPAGNSTTLILAETQPLYIQSSGDLTGSRIVSNQPISFFSGHECAFSPPSQGSGCDHVVEQIPPTVTWGRIFLTAPSADRTTGDVFKVVASQGNTLVNATCVNRGTPTDIPIAPNFTIPLTAAGDSWNFSAGATEYCTIEADKPILVVQFGLGSATGADIYMTLVPAVSQFRNDIRFSVVSSPGLLLVHWTNMFVSPMYFQPANITVNGLGGSPDEWVALRCSNGGVCGYARQLELRGSRSRLIRHDNPEASLGVIVYGSSAGEGYGYPGGLRLSVSEQMCSDGDIRLQGGATRNEGRVEICNNAIWGTVCDDFWEAVDANVACRQLGFSPTGATAFRFASFGQGTGPILLDNVNCSGSETRLVDCPSRGIGNHDCDHTEDAGVGCQLL